MHSRLALILTASLFLLSAAAIGAAQDGKGAWTDPEKARAEDPDFSVQGEYSNGKDGLQLAALGGGRFIVATLKGGLPGQGFDGKSVSATVFDTATAKRTVSNGGFKKVDRKSPTLGASPTGNAIVLFGDGVEGASEWKGGKVSPDGFLMEGTSTKRTFGSFKLHLEFRLPYKPGAAPGGQGRGNSGLYTFNRYETQILDSFALHYNRDAKNSWRDRFMKELGFKPGSDRTQWCACFYKVKTPDVNASTPPLTWQTYDITFTAPGFKDGKRVSKAQFTTLHNGIKVHDGVELNKGTGAGGKRKEVSSEALYLQGHGNPVRFRNIWIVETK